MLMHCQPQAAGFVHAVLAQQHLAVAGVFAGEHVRQLQQVQAAQADVGQVANRRGDHIQASPRVFLAFTGGKRRRERSFKAMIQWQPFNMNTSQR